MIDFVGLSRQQRLITSGPRNSLLALVRSSVWQPICTWSREIRPRVTLGHVWVEGVRTQEVGTGRALGYDSR